MKKVHPYQHMRPRRIEIVAVKNLSYSVSRHAEDQDIRYGFGECERVDEEIIQVVEIDLAWLGVVFHVVATADEDGTPYAEIDEIKDDIEAVKRTTRRFVLKYLSEDPRGLRDVLETIHEASREQGYLEVILNTMGAMDSKLDLSSKPH